MIREITAIAAALSDPSRARTVVALAKGELCVCRIIELLGLAPSTVSKHMSVLKNAGLVQSRKQERWIYYRLPGEADSGPAVRGALSWLLACVAHDDDVRRDARNLSRILLQSPEQLCRNRTVGLRDVRTVKERSIE